MTHPKTAGMALATRIAAFAGLAALSVSSASCAQEKTGIDFDPAVFNLYLESRTQKPADQATAEEVNTIREELTDLYLLSEEPRVEELKKNPRLAAQMELQSRAILAQAVATDFLERNAATDEELQALYAEQTENPSPEYKARHILVETQGEAVALIAELEGGADFAELAKDNSTGPSAPTGGDLGWFPPETMVAEFSTAVQALGDGEFTKAPVQTQFGWHVILREGSRPATPPPFDSIAQTLRQQIEQQKLEDYIKSLRN
jgi:peptidyl-prolyl cis-trans isomerase C